MTKQLDYSSMNEEDLRELQRAKNEQLKALRADFDSAVVSTVETNTLAVHSAAIRVMRAEILSIQVQADLKQQERYTEYQRIAAEADGAKSTLVDADAAAAVSEAERLVGG